MIATLSINAARAMVAAGGILLALSAQAATIAGRVVDHSGRLLAGVRVTASEVKLPECSSPVAEARSSINGEFSIDVSSAVYAVVTDGFSIWNPAAVRVDTRTSNALGIVLQMQPGLPHFIPNDAPRAGRVSVGASSEDGTARITGSAGAVTSAAYVILTTLETGHFTIVEAAADGSFTADHFAPPGSSIMVEADPIGIVARSFLFEGKCGGEGASAPLDGTILRVPDAPSTGPDIHVSGVGRLGCCDTTGPVWIFRGSLNRTTANTGDEIRVQGTFETWSVAFRDVASLQGNSKVALEPAADDVGSRGPLNAFFSSPLMTPTGFPVEHYEKGELPITSVRTVQLTRIGPERLTGTLDNTFRVPANARSGWYRPVLTLFVQSPTEPRSERVMPSIDKGVRHARNSLHLPTIRIGAPSPPRLHWALLLDRFAYGTQGVAALEDRGQFGVTSRIAAQSDTLVIPRIDPMSGRPIVYSLEPYLPQISTGDRGIAPSVPFIPFRFPSGQLTMRIHKPDGGVITAGPSPFVQSRSSTHVNRNGIAVGQGGGHLTDAYQIVTDDPAFHVAFSMDGLHRIELDGEIEDIWGNRWMGGGTYQLYVAKPVVIDTTLLPGTPLETGDALNLGGVILGQSGCDIDIEVALAPRSTRELRRWTLRTRSNRFGRFQPVEAMRFGEPGEYRVDMTAVCRDEQQRLAVGTRSWGGVVASPDSSIVAHGQRGIDAMPAPKPQWFFRSQTNAVPIPSSHVPFPFHAGDVTWMQKSDAALTAITFQEVPAGDLTNLLRPRWNQNAIFDARAADGEIPLFSSRPDRIDPIVDPTQVDVWGYSYRSVQRPGVRVREQIVEDDLRSLYWRFREQYGRQPGVGARGDEPNDFKFQFGGAVLYGPAVGVPRHAIYGSLFVLVPDNDPGGGTRTFPPFQGNGGGPSGGPLFKLKGKDIDLFFHSTGVRPGSILHTRERMSVAGYAAPTLPSKIEITLTSPSGQMRTVSGQANKIGYFYDPDDDFTVNEPGVWKAKTKILFDGLLSGGQGGQVTAPFPTGDILGSRDGEFWFYVVDSTAPPLAVTASTSTLYTAPSGVHYVRPADGPIVFAATLPAGLTNVEMHYTTIMPGFILEEGRTTQLTYIYDAQKLARDFPNLDLYDSDGFAGADTITISLLVSGTDASGARKHFARQIVIQGEELQMPEQSAELAKSKRRVVRR